MTRACEVVAETIPFFLAAEVNRNRGIEAAIDRVLRSGRFILGKEVEGFEIEFAQHFGASHCVAVANGTDALELALRALGIRAGDEVALVANAGGYGTTAVRAIGVRPAYIDVEPIFMGMCPDAFEAQLRISKPRAVIVTHLYGQLARIEEIAVIAARHGVPLVVDCAQAHGATRNGRAAGTFGALGCFSFYPTKNLGALGDAGAVITSDQILAGKLRALRQYGWRSKYLSELAGGRNSRMDELQATILRAKLPFLGYDNQQRRRIARRYSSGLNLASIQLPASQDEGFVAHLYVVRSATRDTLRGHLLENGITCEVHYPVPDHLQPVQLEQHKTPLPVTQRCCETVLSLPCYPGMSDIHVDRVVVAINSFVSPLGSA